MDATLPLLHPFPLTIHSHTFLTMTLLMDRPLPLLPAMPQHPLFLALTIVNKHIPGQAVPPIPAEDRGNNLMNCCWSHRQTMRNQLRNGGTMLGQEITQKGTFPSFSLLLRRSFLSVNKDKQLPAFSVFSL